MDEQLIAALFYEDELVEAAEQGYRDWQAGIYCLPLEFEDRPDLIRRWNSGQDAALKSAALDQSDLDNDDEE